MEIIANHRFTKSELKKSINAVCICKLHLYLTSPVVTEGNIQELMIASLMRLSHIIISGQDNRTVNIYTSNIYTQENPAYCGSPGYNEESG
jgi:hypothetical protein